MNYDCLNHMFELNVSWYIILRTLFLENQSEDEILKNTTGSFEKTVFSTVVPTLPKDTNTFTFMYTIDAELSYVEYIKLMKIIDALQQQKKKWDVELKDTKEQLEKQNKEKIQLSHNNHILRESLEAANKAIKEINGKVYELKQTLVPLREENTSLRKENEDLLENAEFAKQEHTILVKESEEFNKMKLTSEEKLLQKDQDYEMYKTSMQEKLTKLENLYRDYKKEMEKKTTSNAKEIEDLRTVNEDLIRKVEKLKKENVGLKSEVESLQRRNNQLEEELRKRKSLDMQLLHTSKEKDKLTENAQEIEKFYRKEIEEVNGEITKATLEIEKYKEDTRNLQGENDKLKFDLESLQNKMKDVEVLKEALDKEKQAGEEKAETIQNEVAQLQKELDQVEGIKQDNLNFDKDRKEYLSQIEVLQDKLREFEGIKREQFVQQHEHQRTKAELERLRNDLKEFDTLKREHLSEKFEKERLLSELQHLQKQLSLLEDQQRILQNPNSFELKDELEKIRNEMKDLAAQNQSRSVDLYTSELKGELASLKNQIKELDINNRHQDVSSTNTHTETIQREITNTLLIQEEGKVNSSYQRESGSNSSYQEESGNSSHQSEPGNSSYQSPYRMPKTFPKKVVVDHLVTATLARETESSAVPSANGAQSPGDSSAIGVQSSGVPPSQEGDQHLVRHNGNNEKERGNKEESIKEVPYLRRKSTGEVNKIYVSKSTELSRAAAPDNRERENIDNEKVKLKLIEDRIRRKREKNTDWSIRTPSIDRMRRKSAEELSSMDFSSEMDGDTKKHRRRRRRSERSPSIGRSKSADPNRLYQGIGPDTGKHQPGRRERGRSPHRRDRYQPQSGDFESYDHQRIVQGEWKPPPKSQYAVEITVDNAKMIKSERTDDRRGREDYHPSHPSQVNHQGSRDAYKSLHPSQRNYQGLGYPSNNDARNSHLNHNQRRRVRSEERRRERRKSNGDSASSSDNDEYYDEQTKRKPRERHHSLSSSHFASRNAETPDLLEEAMRERQHQAIINKKGISSIHSFIHRCIGRQLNSTLILTKLTICHFFRK